MRKQKENKIQTTYTYYTIHLRVCTHCCCPPLRAPPLSRAPTQKASVFFSNLLITHSNARNITKGVSSVQKLIFVCGTPSTPLSYLKGFDPHRLVERPSPSVLPGNDLAQREKGQLLEAIVFEALELSLGGVGPSVSSCTASSATIG